MKIMIINCEEIGSKDRHAPGLYGFDRTLCGIAYEGVANKESLEATIRNGTITCPDCIEIIDYCKSILAKDIVRS